MNTFNRSLVHTALVEAGISVYESGDTYRAACDAFASCVDEAREILSPSDFAKWTIAEFGTGGSTGAEDYVEGDVPHALRADGMLANRMLTKADIAAGVERDYSADRVNTWVAACRAILRKMASDATFTWQGSFDRTKRAAQSGGTSNRAGTGEKATKPDKSATKPGSTVVVTAEQGRAWVESNMIDALDVMYRALVARKASISASTVKSVHDALAAEAKAKAEAEAKAKPGKTKKSA